MGYANINVLCSDKYVNPYMGYTDFIIPAGMQEPENSTILPGPRAVLNDDEGGLCLWPPGV